MIDSLKNGTRGAFVPTLIEKASLADKKHHLDAPAN